jgi:DNA-binding FadR family transcriptional regulator
VKQTSERAATKVARNIVQDIKTKALSPGTKLDAEHVMVEQQGVARATVREALRLLEFQGALRIKPGPGGGPVVNVPDINHLTSALSLQLQFANATFRSVLDARKAIYPVLVAEAAVNATHQDISALRQALSRIETAIEESDSAILEMRHFYELIASASRNMVLGFMLNALHRMSEPTRIKYDAARWRASLRDTGKILDAIERGDADEAREFSTRAMDAAMRYQEKTAPDILDEPVSWVTAD